MKLALYVLLTQHEKQGNVTQLPTGNVSWEDDSTNTDIVRNPKMLPERCRKLFHGALRSQPC